MSERTEKRFPAWAEEERAEDMVWSQENRPDFWPRAQQGYDEVGRGAMVIDTTLTVAHPGGIGHPSGYVDQQTLDQIGDEDTQRLVSFCLETHVQAKDAAGRRLRRCDLSIA